MRKVPFIYGVRQTVALNSKDTLIVPIQESDFLVSDLVASAAGDFEVINLSSSGEDEDKVKGSNAHKDIVFGIAGKPLYLPRAWRVLTKNQIIVDVLDISGAANLMSLAFTGNRMAPGEERPPAKREDFKMFAGKSSLAGGASGTINLIVGNHDFALIGLIYKSTGAFDVSKITDNSSDRELLNTRLAYDAVFGTVQNPRYLPGRRIYPANATIQIDVVDTSTAPNVVYVGLLGVNLIGKK